MLQAAINAEVDGFVEQHRDRRDEEGRRLVVKNGSLPAREILTGAGSIEVSQGRVRDNSPTSHDRVQFTPSVLPAYLRRTDAIEELIPWLYLKGISTGDFAEALQALVGERAKGLSANVVVRLKEQWAEEYEQWSRQDLSGRRYAYVWADGIYARAFSVITWRRIRNGRRRWRFLSNRFEAGLFLRLRLFLSKFLGEVLEPVV